MKKWCILFMLCTVLLQVRPEMAAAAPDADVVIYRMRKGDSLYALAKRYFQRPADYLQVQRRNHVNNPYRIAIGRMVVIPRDFLKFEPIAGKVFSFRGNVRLIRDGHAVPVATGAPVLEGDLIATAANSFISIRLPDESAIALPSQSRIAVRRLRKTTLTGGIDRLFEVEQGRVRALVTPLGQPDTFRVATPIAVSAVRGTEFRVAYSPADHRAGTETLSGVVATSNANVERRIAAGYGAVASSTTLSDAVALLPAPALVEPGRIQDERDLAFHLKALAGATGYHVQIARDAGFLDEVSEATAAKTTIHLPSIPDGTWFVRVSAIDASGLEGQQETYAFERRLNDITTSVAATHAGRYRQYLFRWAVIGAGQHQYRFQLSRHENGSVPVIDEPGLSAQKIVITDLQPGTYYWRVMTLQFLDNEEHAKWSPTERLTISAR